MHVLPQGQYSPILSVPEKGTGRAVMLCLFLSFFVHAGAFALVPDLEYEAEQTSSRTLQVNLMSMARPAIDPAKIEPAAGESKTPDLKIVSEPEPKKTIARPNKVQTQEPVPERKIVDRQIPKRVSYSPPAVSSNDRGREETTVIPVLKEARILNRTPPHYPARARRMGRQGTVLLHALVTADGRTQDLKIVSSSGHKSLDQSAIKAVKNWAFASATKNGKPIKAWVEVPVEFVLR